MRMQDADLSNALVLLYIEYSIQCMRYVANEDSMTKQHLTDDLSNVGSLQAQAPVMDFRFAQDRWLVYLIG